MCTSAGLNQGAHLQPGGPKLLLARRRRCLHARRRQRWRLDGCCPRAPAAPQQQGAASLGCPPHPPLGLGCAGPLRLGRVASGGLDAMMGSMRRRCCDLALRWAAAQLAGAVPGRLAERSTDGT